MGAIIAHFDSQPGNMLQGLLIHNINRENVNSGLDVRE